MLPKPTVPHSRIIFDTDIGTDVDDCLALALLLGSPEVRLEGITCVYGDVGLRSQMCRKMLALRGDGSEVIPVCRGLARTILGVRPIHWVGHEGVGLLDEDDVLPPEHDEHAVDFIVRTVMASPGEIHLLAVGPLTNVAVALLREPRLATSLAHLTIMGGAIQGAARVEHNIRCDPEAAHIVLSSGAPMTLVPLDVTTRVTIDAGGHDRILATGTPFHRAVADQVARYPAFRERGATYLHDPLAAACVLQPELFSFHDLRVSVELADAVTAGLTRAQAPTAEAPATARVALDVEVAAAETAIIERIAR
ncbi:MAG: nucleoside hydrolase [Chloroflexota bacterium]|nr:nucleoside hydrolase [Chloroflexota bacterium]